jgi:hypothetical protein
MPRQVVEVGLARRGGVVISWAMANHRIWSVDSNPAAYAIDALRAAGVVLLGEGPLPQRLGAEAARLRAEGRHGVADACDHYARSIALGAEASRYAPGDVRRMPLLLEADAEMWRAAIACAAVGEEGGEHGE